MNVIRVDCVILLQVWGILWSRNPAKRSLPSILPVLATHGLLRHNRNDIGGQKQWRRRLLTLFRPSRRHAAYSAPAAAVRAPRRLSLIRWITAQFPTPENPDRMAAHACPERQPDADIDIGQPEYHGSPPAMSTACRFVFSPLEVR